MIDLMSEEDQDSSGLLGSEDNEPSIAQRAKKKKKDKFDDLDDLVDETEEEGSESFEEVDKQLMEAAPELKEELAEIEASDFSQLNIEEGASSAQPEPPAKKKFSLDFLKTFGGEHRVLILSIFGIFVVFIPLFILTVSGKLLPNFKIPYLLSYNEISKDIHTYDLQESHVPLFDSFRTKAFTLVLPQTIINLKPVEGKSSFGRFEFSINVRDKEYAEVIEKQQSSVIDLIQRTLEQVTWDDMSSPLGKEKVKKILRYRLNEYFQSDIVIGVYYKSIILTK